MTAGTHQRPLRLIAAAALTGSALFAATACGAAEGTSGGAKEHKLSIVAFSAPEAATTAIQEAFQKTPAGKGVTFGASYGASGDQSRAVESGLKADYVHFSVATDVDRLVKDGLVDANWDKGPNKGVIARSVVVIGVRKGNPKHIHGWDDLVKPGVKIVTPNPASSGSARWNALAAWGHITQNGGTEQQAEAFEQKLFNNVVSLTNSGRDATTAFVGGTGDAILAYENEAILANQKGSGFDYIIPDDTIQIDTTGAITKKADPKAKDFLDFVLSDAGQKQFALKGFRPIRDNVDFGGKVEGATDPSNPFPAVKKLFTIQDFGGWSAVKDKLFGDGKDGKPVGIITTIIEKSGKASS